MSFEQYEEMVSEQFSRQDYLSEAFGAEARCLAAQANAEWEELRLQDEAQQAAFIGPVFPIEVVLAMREAQRLAEIEANKDLPF